MKVSIITVVYNRANSIESAITSVLSQSYKNMEYIIIDGNSNDGTTDIIHKYRDQAIILSEPDKGMYDALNKGIKLAKGDYIGILHSDDVFSSNKVIEQMMSIIKKDRKDVYFGDVKFVRNNKTIRQISGAKWKKWKVYLGIMPAHPSYFCKRELFKRFGGYNTRYKICSDYDLIIRHLIKNNLSYEYIPLNTTDMSLGGLSSSGIRSTITINKEILTISKNHEIRTNYILIYLKYVFRLFELRL